MTRRAVAAALLVAAACAGPAARVTSPPAVAPEPAGLPVAAAVATERFPGVATCVRCHTAGDHGAMRGAAGADISPVTDAATTVMALAARDPYFLAAFRRELRAAPGASAGEVQALCVRCHAPVGAAEAAAIGGALGIDDLLAGASPAAQLGREGVGCAGCHSATPAGADDEAAEEARLVGRVPLRTDRGVYGAVAEPQGAAMVAMIRSTPMPSEHVTQSALCASCHTVIVHPRDASGRPTADEVVEQATFLEWRTSASADPGGATCQDCHQARVDDATPFSTRPPTAPARSGYRRHAIRGGNAYLLDRLAAATSWLGAGVTSAQLTAAARETDALLATAAQLQLAAAGADLAITVINRTGHKLPTGYPTRRMWLHVVATDAAGRVVLESGRPERGAIVDDHGAPLDAPGVILPHVDRVASARDVAVWEAVPVDAAGRRTHLLLATARFAKDDRILPPAALVARATRVHTRDVERTRPVGVAGDADFAPGRDTVTVALPASAARVEVELLYQAIPPETLASYAPSDGPEAARFLAIAAAPPTPSVLATATWARP